MQAELVKTDITYLELNKHKGIFIGVNKKDKKAYPLSIEDFGYTFFTAKKYVLVKKFNQRYKDKLLIKDYAFYRIEVK